MDSELISRNRSGELFLLTKNSEKCFLTNIEFKSAIREDDLRFAVDQAAKRFPLIASRVLLHDEVFYYASNSLPIVIKTGNRFPLLTGEETNHHLVYMLIDGNRLMISTQHSLTDGVGMTRFIGTVLYYYRLRTGGEIDDPGDIRVDDGEAHPEIWADPFEHRYEVPESGDDSPEAMQIVTDGLVLPENTGELDYRHFRMEIDSGDYLRFCQQENTTPFVATALLMMHAINEELSDPGKPIAIRFPVDVRHHLGVDESLRNAVVMRPMRYTPEEMTGLSFSEQAGRLKTQVVRATDVDEIKKSVNGFIGILHDLDGLGAIDKKQDAMRSLRRTDTTAFLLSYVRLRWPESVQTMIDSISVTDLEPYLKLNVWALNQVLYVDLIQPFATDRYVKALSGQLSRHGVGNSWKERELMVPEMDLKDITLNNGGCGGKGYEQRDRSCHLQLQ